MRITKSFIILFLCFSTILPAIKNQLRSGRFNSNTWRISIGKKELLSSTKNEIGDEILLDKKTIQPKDMLHVQRYFCGFEANNATTHLVIKNNFDKILKEYTHHNSSILFEVDAPMSDFINEFISGQTLKIYFSTSETDSVLAVPVLLGRIKIK